MKKEMLGWLIKRKRGKTIYKIVGWNSYFKAPIILNLKTGKKYPTKVDDNWVRYSRLDFGRNKLSLKLYKNGI
jgi:hypothetical protein